MMEEEERQRKLEAGKAKLAEYRQRKAQSDGQKKQKKKKKKKSESEVEERVRDEPGENNGDQPEGEQNTVFSLSKTLRCGETVTHDQTYTIEPESEVSTTAEDCSSEVNGFHERTERELSSCVIVEEDLQQSESHMEPDLKSSGPQSRKQIKEDELAAKNLAMEELNHGLEEIRATFGTEGVQQLQDFEEALKQRDEIITQLTMNLQQARAEKEEVMREFLELTEQSQKLQIQFQQLQAGEILRSSNISSTAADLLQARQQISLYQQQLEEKDAQVKGHQEEQLLLITQLQERLSDAERVHTQAEQSFAQSLRDKEQLNSEQQCLISKHLQSLAQLQDHLLNSSQQLEEVNKHLTVKTQELENCERELSVSRQKERMSSGEILQLMKTVEDLQQRCHQGSQSEGETLQRMEDDWTCRMDQLRAELDEMYGQQIVQMKQELRVQNTAEVDRIKEEHSVDVEKIVQQHRSELERFKGQLSQSVGGVNVLNVKVIELQNKLQESQVLREKAEQELTRMSEEKLNLASQVERLHQELTHTRAEAEMRSKSPEKSQTEMQLLRDAISDLQMQLHAAQKANGDLEAKHESEITNYKIKLDMLEREKDAVLDRMAESQEAELERLRTQLLFSHEEELSRLRVDLQRESQLNVENLRGDMTVRHREALELLRTDFEDKLRSVESERAVLATERVSLLQEIVELKNDLNQVLESSRAEELVAELKVLQGEVEDLRRRDSERVTMKNDDWENERKDMASENKTLKESNAAMKDELTHLKQDRETLLRKIDNLSIESEQKQKQMKDFQDEIEKQKNTFSFAEKNFEVNYQELKDEYTCLVNAKGLLEERLIKETMEYEAKLCDLNTKLKTRSLRDKTDDEEADGRMLIEKDTTELMEKLEVAGKEKNDLAERLSETVAQVTLMEDELKMVKRERDEIVVRNKELESQRQTLTIQPLEDCVVAGGLCSVETHHTHIKSLKEEIMMLQSSLLSVEQEHSFYQERLIALTQESPTLKERLSMRGGTYRYPSPQTAVGSERETPQSTTASHTAKHEDPLTALDGRCPQQVKTGDTPADRDAVRHEMMQLQDMDSSEHDECRLQMEAQRISLSQIHAAQLEVLRESLFAQTQEQLRIREEELWDAHAHELLDLQDELKREQQGVRGQHTELNESSVQQLKSEFQEHSAHLEESHRREIEHLKICYQQQMEEKQERFTAEILLLQQRLQELTGAEEHFSVPSVCQSRARDEQHEPVQDEESLSVDAEEELVSAGLWRELQAVQEVPYESSCEEVTDLDVERDAQIRSHPEETHLTHLQEKHHQELLVQEIAKVIVQMSVEFAQQTELRRISKQTRETSAAVQTDDTEEEMRRESEGSPDESVTDDWSDSVTVMKSPRCTQSSDEEHICKTEEETHEDGDDDDEESEIPSETQFDEDDSEMFKEEQEDRKIPPELPDDDDEDEDQCGVVLAQEICSELIQQEEEHTRVLEELRSSHTQQMEVYLEQNTHLITQIHTLNQQLLQREEELQQMKGETQRDQQSYPCMQNRSTQTEQKTMEAEVMKGRGHETTVTSQSSTQDSELSSDVITTERDLLRKANSRLRQVLSDVLKTTAAAEETIGRHVEGILESSKSQLRATWKKIPSEGFKPNTLTPGPAGDMSSERFHGSETGADDISVFSGETDEGLEMLQKIPGVELQLQEAELQLEREEYLMSISTRLQSAVEKLLITITETSTQLEHAHVTQTELMREKFRHNEEIEELLGRQEELQERLSEEGRAREQLALELHKAEGLIDGYTGERLGLEQQIRERADLQLHFEQELHVTSSRLRELEQERLQIQQERELLSRQQDAMRDGAGSQELRLVEAAIDAAPEADLLEETEKLMAEKVAVQRQAQKDSDELQLQVRQLEAELEEQVSRLQELQELHRTEGADLRQQIQALEKQLENNRRFMDEQAADREHERDVFQQEIQNLEQQLKNPPKSHAASEQRDREVQELRSALQEKSDWCSELLLRSEQLQRDVQERDEEIDTLGAHVTELQHTLMQRVEEVPHVSMAGRVDVTLEAQLQTEREALDRKEKEIVNLEEQLEQFREELENKSEEVNQLHMQLEIQRKKISSHQQELQDHTRLTQVLEEKDRQIAVLNEQIAKLQHTGSEPEKEVLEEKDEVLRELEGQVEYLRSEQERLKRNSEEEVDQLNAVIEKLQQELSHIEHKQPQEDETPGVREEYNEMKQKMDEVTRELGTLKADHSSLKSRYESLQEEAFAQKDSEMVAELEEALMEKTAAFLVVQAEVQALEESAGSRVMSLSQRVEELEICVEEKDSELHACRLKVEQAQTDADDLYRKVIDLEEKLREKVAAVLVSQVQLGAIQSQTKELHAEAHAGDVTSEEVGLRVELESEDVASTPASGGKMSLLTETLKELEEGLSGMQKDQELQKQLFSSSEEELHEYERRLAVLMELLDQMRTKPTQHRPLPSAEHVSKEGPDQSISELLQELQEVKGEAASTKQELNCYRELSHKLQEEIEQMKESTIAQLQTALSQVSADSREQEGVAAKLHLELQEVRGQMASTQQELDGCKDQSATLQELLQEREMSIARLKDQLDGHASQESTSELLQELQEVKGEAVSTKEELNSYRERSLKLQEEIEQMKESTIAQLQTALSQVSADSREQEGVAAKLHLELQEVRGQMASTQQELDGCKDQSATLQELLQEREMSIARLKDQLDGHASQESTSELLQELQEVKGEAVSTKEELNSYRERSLKLQEEIEIRDASIAQLKENVQQLQTALIKSSDEPSSHPNKNRNKHGDNRENHGNNESVDTPPLSHRNSTDQSERSTSSSSLNVTSRVSHVDVGTQAEPSRSEDMEEMIASHTEKIGQMQELHAAEIMDMETRHITESENLKRENQQLEEECQALRDAIEKLRTAEGPSVRASERPAVSPFKDEYASDSSSDWSQRTGHDLPHRQLEFRTTPEGARRDIEPDVLPDRIKVLMREVHQEGMQVLSLSEIPLSEVDGDGAQITPPAWSKERDALINTIESHKSLISKLQTNTDTQVGVDWRSDLLSAVQRVFVQERDVLKNVLYSHLERVDTADAVVHLNQLERALVEQDVRHRELMGTLCSADRNSLISEIHQLRTQLSTLVSDVPNAPHSRHHVDTAAGMETEGERERSQVLESSSDILVLQDLKTELTQTKLELETTLKSQHKLLKELDTLRSEVSLKANEVDSLTERLSEEQKRLRELQWAFEKEKCRSERMQESEREETEDLKLYLEEQRGRVAELSSSLEKERQISAQLREHADGQQEREISVSSELQVQLDAQRARADELSSALEKQKELNAQLIQQIQTSSTAAQNQQKSETHQTFIQAEATCSQVEAGVLSVESLLQTLQTQLAEKQTQVVQMMEELERQKLDAVQRKRQFDEEKSALVRSAAQDQNALRAALDSLSRMERQTGELQTELNAERQNVQRLELERDRLKERVRQLEERVRQSENTQSVRSDSHPPPDLTRDWVLQQNSGDALTLHSSSTSSREVAGSGVAQSSDPKHMDKILSRLDLIAGKINNLTRSPVEAPDRESLAWLHSNVQDVMSLLQHIPSAPSALPESTALLVGGSSSLLNERLLRQNAELTGFVSRLTEEKNDLRNQLLKLEDELRRCRQYPNSSENVWSRSSVERQQMMLFSSERETWAQEKSRLEKCLHQTEVELNRLRGEIRSDTLREMTGSDTDNSTLKRLYGKYLRSESFRKALIYQKKYLLLLLGGFQECEEATLSLIARMGGHPTHTCLESVSHQRRGFTRFRSAVRVSIALSRMKFLVKRWHRASVGPITSQIISRNGIGQIRGSDERNQSSYLHPGSVEVFRERRATSRGRTGRDSPRSTASVQHRYHSVSGDTGAVLSSHLQNYDPDRALTDYISRLEALQRRLGSVQSGSSSYAQLHLGVRR
ncbi:A-kinase anchor protein 9 [Xyrauchen texanus]|uniref:A-kinase anchor protein 9 n=1 Tax=Xyrauchen texanus TaxID=154827 RepID=UPI002242A495|nr:A-kinase anchor protein 9 [Xyrauchen texanus]